MVLLSLLSAALLALPVAVTVALYIGVESQRVFHGGGKTFPSDNKAMTTTYCQKANIIAPYPGRYTFNPNQWGDPDNTGALCMNITTKGGVSAKELFAASFSATWEYPQGPETEPVHAFPNAQLDSTALPITVSNIGALGIDVNWSYALGNRSQSDTDSDALTAGGLAANVCIDMFLSDDKTKASSTTAAQHEVMVWFGRWGAATQPIGHDVGVVETVIIGDTTFDLYTGSNGVGQSVSTWIARGNTTSFNGDVNPLVQTLLTIDGGPSSGTYLGYYAFGSETYFSSQNVTFTVPKLELDVSSK